MNVILLTATHFHNQDEVLEFSRHVNTLEMPAGFELRIAVSDNSRDWEESLNQPQNLLVVRPSKNLGYLNGCAFAYKYWSEREAIQAELVAVVNTDLEFSSEFFVRLLGHRFSDRVGVIAPDIVLPSGKRQNPHLMRRVSKPKMRFYSWVFRTRILGRLYLLASTFRSERIVNTDTNYSRSDEPPVQQEIYSPHGSAFFLRRPFFENNGRLEFGSFLYCEELHIAEQASQIGVDIVWMPGTILWHNQHSTTGSINYEQRLRWMSQSYRYILDAYYQ